MHHAASLQCQWVASLSAICQLCAAQQQAPHLELLIQHLAAGLHKLRTLPLDVMLLPVTGITPCRPFLLERWLRVHECISIVWQLKSVAADDIARNRWQH
jgi:hypothetical protein